MELSAFLNISLSLLEWLAIMGLTQSILIVAYIIVRLYNWRQAVLPMFYFSVLGLAFLTQFALRLEDIEGILRIVLWSCWALIPPLSYLLILQISYSKPPRWREYWIVFLPIIVLSFILMMNKSGNVCGIDDAYYCSRLFEWFHLSSGVIGSMSLLFLFSNQDLFKVMRDKNKGGYERYWLVISLIIMNMGGAAVNILRSSEANIPQNIADAVLLVMGLGFVYVTTTMFFRIYPPALSLKGGGLKKKIADLDSLSEEDYSIALKIQDLIELDKLYHEPSFSRADLARELNISESALSGIINTAFGKTLPQILNENRVEDAKRMLKDVKIPIQTIAFEVGFNSLPSFNRVFKNITGKSPSIYRSEKLKA